MRVRRRRIYSILGFLGIVAFIFMCFQLFTLEVLNSENAREARFARLEHHHPHEELVLPPAMRAVPQRDRPHTPKIQVEGLRPDINEHAMDDECLPGSDCAKRLKIKKEHLGEKRINKYGPDSVERPVTKKDDPMNDSAKDTLQDSNKRLMDRIEKFGQYVDKKIKENEDFEKVFKNKLEKLKTKNGTTDTQLRSPNKENVSKVKLRSPGFVLGVLDKDQHLYNPDASDKFTCLESKEQILWENLNDDFCDCHDGSDEPGTSACPNSRFYCTFQLEGSKALWVWSSLVNDGICDCCDGSDENQGVRLSDHVKHKGDGPFAGIFQAPCQDRCSDFLASNMKKTKGREEGLKVRQEFVNSIKRDYHQVDAKLYGDDGGWYYLMKGCFDIKSDKYQYKFCPFRSVSQHDQHSSTNIGRNPVWQSYGYLAGYRLLMDGGDARKCPDGRVRKTLVEFSCGIENKLLGVHESESCSYSIQFDTPLACL